jgi:hypothetical protein
MMPDSGPLRLAEAAGVLSLATDLAMGQPLEHGMRTAVLGVRTAAVLGLPEQDLAAVFYTGLLHFAGCTASSEIDARFLGDELVVRPQLMAALYGSRPALAPAAAAEELRREAEAGRLAPEAVTAVLAAAGQPRPPVRWPGGLSSREREVLGLLARGMATKQAARQLG